MSAQLDLVVKRAATWSQTANQLKDRLDSVRWLVFGLAIVGALMAAIASQMPEAGSVHGTLTALGTVLLAAGTFISARLLRDSDVQTWVRARASSEALKREAFKYATKASPYDSGVPEQTLENERRKIEANLDDLADREVTPVGVGSAPTVMLTPDQYREQRILQQINKFYRPKAFAYRKIVSRLRKIEFVLALAATIITALAGVVGKFPIMAGARFDLAALTAVLTTISGAIVAHIEASRYAYLVTSYVAAARRLEDANTDFAVASADPKAWSEFVNKCEDIITAENSSWVARWTKPETK
jgi:SMODS and SLOG-associating 2TM effector domain 1/Protein of unknown function (DUF4231)